MRRFSTAAALLIFTTFSPAAHAADRFWNTSNGFWSSQTSWTNSTIPAAADHAFINYFNGAGGLARINTTAISAVTAVTVTNGGSVSISNQGSLLVGTDFVVGLSNTHGTLNVLTTNPNIGFPGGLTVLGNLRVGVLSGIGSFTQDAGSVTVLNDIMLGDRRASGSIFDPFGAMTLTGTAALRAEQLSVGHSFGSGSLSVRAFASLTLNHALSLGGLGSTGVATQTGGNITTGFLSINPYSFNQPDPLGSTFTMSGGNLNAATTSIQRNCVFNYNGGSASLGDLQIWDGALRTSAGGNKVLRVSNILVRYDQGVLDLNDNRMVITNPDLEQRNEVRGALSDGYNGGNWLGKGITSAAAAAVAASGTLQRTGLGYGYEPGSTQFVVKYTRLGDATLDGLVNLDDFNRLASAFGGFADWGLGDFNYDTRVDLDDFNLLAANFNLSAGPDGVVDAEDWSALAAAIPEPATALGLSIFALLGRRRRTSR